MPELQRLQAGHAAAVLAFELANRAYFAAFISDRGDEFYDQFTERHSALLAEQDAGIGAFYVLAAEDGSVLGRFNLVFSRDGAAELGYRVAQHVAGRGVATAAVLELCQLAAARHGLRTLRAATSSGNIASQKVLTKAGFVPVGPADPAHLGGKPGTWYQRDLTRDPDPSPASPSAAAERVWAGLDQPWQEAFRQAWEALRTGNIAVGACASTAAGEIICSARNRVNDAEGPPGEVFGSALAHAETNVLARLPFRSRRDLVLTTTLQPCLQCAGAIRLGPVATVRFAGPDRYWDGCHDFGKLSAREADRVQPRRIGPRCDELGAFATLISRFAHLPPGYEQALRALGEGPMVDLVHELEGRGEVRRLAAMDVDEGLGYLWPHLQELTGILPA